MKYYNEFEVVASLGCETGENPLWHLEAKKLLFVDIPVGKIYAYDPDREDCVVFCQTRTTGGFTLQHDGSLLLFQDGGISSLTLDGSLCQLATDQCPGNDRFNDVIADPVGRVFAGAMGGNGRLLRFDLDGSATEMFDGIGIPNGMGFTPDLQGMYFTDSLARKIYYFDYERTTGDLTNRRVFAEIPEDEGLPDGMVVDSDGYIWTAIWSGSRVKRYDPDGRVDFEIFLPAKLTTSLAFGGSDLTDIYVTSAVAHGPDSQGGDLYRLRIPDVKGKPPFRSRVKFSKT